MVGAIVGGLPGRREKLPRMPLRQMNVLIPEDELERLKKRANAKGISVAEYVRRARTLQFGYQLWVEREAARPPEGGEEGA